MRYYAFASQEEAKRAEQEAATSYPALTTTPLQGSRTVAFFPIDQSSRDRLAATPGVTIVSNPLPHRPGDVALVMAGLRCCEVLADGAAFRAAYHLRLG